MPRVSFEPLGFIGSTGATGVRGIGVVSRRRCVLPISGGNSGGNNSRSSGVKSGGHGGENNSVHSGGNSGRNSGVSSRGKSCAYRGGTVEINWPEL